MAATFRALFIAATLATATPRRRSRYQRISPLRRRTYRLRAFVLVRNAARGV